MTDEEIDSVLARVAAIDAGEADADLSAIRNALLLEDSLGLTLSDEEMNPAHLGNAASIRRLLTRHE